jgi:hypothetical protein
MSSDQTQELPLRLEVCPRCDYSLTGLAAVGVCPECGREYDQFSVFLYGEPAASELDAWGRQPTWWRSSLIGTGCVALLGFMFLSWTRYWGRLSIVELFLIAIFGLGFVLQLWSATRDRVWALTQVMLSPDGVRQAVRGPGPIPYELADQFVVFPWRAVRSVRLKRVSGDQILLTITSSMRWWEYGRVYYVNAKLRCTPAQADALELRISQWRQAAAAGDS